jgi:hypothetical protein
MGQWRHRHQASAHKRARAAAEASFSPATTCSICHHPIGESRWDLDHADDGTYRGLAHSSPCRICGRRCNQSEGGRKAAREAGKQLRDRTCVICGKPYTVTSNPARQATCGGQACISALRRRRRAGEPDGEPPPLTGRPW